MAMLEKCTSEREEHLIATVTALKGSLDSVSLGKSFYFDAKTGVLQGCPSGDFQDFVLERIADVRNRKKSGTYTYEKGEVAARVFVELIPPPYHLAIYGDNYDVYPMLELAGVMDWEVSLTGNIQKLKKEKLAPVSNLYPKDADARPGIDHRTAVILMAHDYKTDISNLKELIKSPAPYIGSLGPRKRFEKMLRELGAGGLEFSEAEMARIYAPCGLEIGANTPEEIASSIFSEILSAFSGKPGGMLREKSGPIHERD
jgi:xanthine/CO dehydrogenase XdhC/CoxF family maturation factor